MSYDPFARGPFPVGVRTATMNDTTRDRLLPIEVWYPAEDRHAGQDVSPDSRDTYEVLPGFPPAWQDAVRDAAPQPGKTFPLIAFSHGYGGARRQSTFVCTHLASHGYVVAAVDHTGNTTLDTLQQMMAMQSGMPVPKAEDALGEFIEIRPKDVEYMIDRVLDGSAGDVARLVIRDAIGMTGHSFGGWTTLRVTALDRRVRAAVPLAPAGGSSPLPVAKLTEALDFNWGRSVPTLYLVAEKDSLLPLKGMRELYEKTPPPKQMVVLKNADHMHFCDRIEEIHEMFRIMPPPGEFQAVAASVLPISELCASKPAYEFVRGLTLAHMDAHLKGNESAAQLLGNLPHVLVGREIDAAIE